MRRLAYLAALLPLLAAGCFLPYAYPNVCYLPPVEVNAPGRTATAFRVDVSEWRRRFIGGSVRPTMAFTDQTDEAATTSAVSVHLNSGFMVAPVMHGGHRRYTCMKLYRRGYRTVVLEPWSDISRVEWVACENAEERLQAIRDLLYATPAHSAPVLMDGEPSEDGQSGGGRHEWELHPRTGWVKEEQSLYTFFYPQIRPGSWSDAHRKGLEFAHDEFEALTKDADVDEKVRKRAEYLMHRLDEVIER